MKNKIFVSLVLFIFVSLPWQWALANSASQPMTGTLTGFVGSSITFKSTSGSSYSAEFSSASLQRKNGSPMTTNEYVIGDKLEVFGKLWNDNSISASRIRDLSLYPRTGTFSGKITEIDPTNLKLVIQNSQPLTKTLTTNSLTSIKINGTAKTFSDLLLGMSVSAKGQWERTDGPITISKIDAKVRYVAIKLTGEMVIKESNNITILSNNTIYGIDLTNAKILNKAGKSINAYNLNAGGTVLVEGKHISGSVAILAGQVKER